MLNYWVTLIFLVTAHTVHGLVVSHDLNDVHFHLFPDKSNTNYSEELVFKNESTIRGSQFKTGQLTVFFIHGFMINPTVFIGPKNAYLASTDPVISSSNIIFVDWSKLSTPVGLTPTNVILAYFETLQNVGPVGGRIGDFLLWLRTLGYLSLDQVHVVGHSAGAHVAGNVGKRVQSVEKKNISRVTGLDPAGPFFQPVPFPGLNVHPLSPKDAAFVDAIHTAAGTLGDTTVDGVAAFYPNGGMRQPGCNDLNVSLILPFACSHTYAINLWEASVNKEYIGCECPYPNLGVTNIIRRGSCLNPCNQPTVLGVYCQARARGKFYLETPNPP